MKSILIIGMGNFGICLADNFRQLKNDVMIVDKDEDIINELAPLYTEALIANCTNPAVIKKLNVHTFDVCFVTIGGEFQSSLEITSLLKENGAKKVIAFASHELQKKFLLKNGADDVIYPDADLAEKVAIKYNSDSIFNYLELENDFAVFEIEVPKKWINKSIRVLNVRNVNRLDVLAIKKNGVLSPMPSPEYVFEKDDHVMVLGQSSDVYKIVPKR